MNRDRTRTPASKARALALREARRIASARRLLAIIADAPTAPALPTVFA